MAKNFPAKRLKPVYSDSGGKFVLLQHCNQVAPEYRVVVVCLRFSPQVLFCD